MEALQGPREKVLRSGPRFAYRLSSVMLAAFERKNLNADLTYGKSNELESNHRFKNGLETKKKKEFVYFTMDITDRWEKEEESEKNVDGKGDV